MYLLVKKTHLVADGFRRVGQRRNKRHQILGAGIGFVGEHSPAPHHIAFFRRALTVQAPAQCLSV